MGWMDNVAKGIGDAIGDIRSKLEEATWGREVTDKGSAQESPQWPETKAEPALGSHTREIDREREKPDLEVER